jgi:VanZ family protein
MQLADRLSRQWRHRLFIAYMVAMVLLFVTPVPQPELLESRYIDKVVHFGLFFGFALLFHTDRAANPGWTFLISTLFAALIELAQWLLPFRDVDWMDFIAGAAGAAAATAGLKAASIASQSGS